MKNKLIIAVLTLIFSLSGSIYSQTDRKEEREKFNPATDPFKELQTAVTGANKLNKRIILDVGGEWCIWCHRIDAFIDQNSDIKKYLNKHFIVVKINYSEENKNEKFLSQYPKVDGYPHFFVLDKNGKLLNSQNTGLLEKEKSYDREKFMTFLKKWTD